MRVLGKGDRERVVPVGDAALAALDRYLAGRRSMSGPLFTNRRGGRLTHAERAADRRAGEPARPGSIGG